MKKKEIETDDLPIKQENTDAELPQKVIRGVLIEDKVVISDDFNDAQEFYDKSCFGEIHGAKNKVLELALVEALYLMERNKLKIYLGSKLLTLEDFLTKAIHREHNFWNRWRVFRDIRTRGYVLKTALKFGADFRVYRRGMKPGDDHAKWILFCVSENQQESWREFAAKMRVSHSTRKTLLIGCVDDQGDCVFYECRWIKP